MTPRESLPWRKGPEAEFVEIHEDPHAPWLAGASSAPGPPVRAVLPGSPVRAVLLGSRVRAALVTRGGTDYDAKDDLHYSSHPRALARRFPMPHAHGFMAGRYPQTRLRRPRRHGWSRRLVQEHHLRVEDLIWPLFVHDQPDPVPIPTMPGVYRWPIDELVRQAERACTLGIPAIAIFPATDPTLKTPDAEEALNPENLVCRSVRAVKQVVGDRLGVICDVALDPYSSHGHDGLVRHGQVVNDETVQILCQQAVVQAEAGCDVIAPSDMMDGRIGAIRRALDARGFEHLILLSYAAKYASAFYGPFRDAVGSSQSLGNADKKTYQMDPANGAESLREVAMDIDEGADWVMVKPGLPYLDIVYRVKSEWGLPTLVYQVSGEYAMLTLAAQQGALDRRRSVLESLLSMKRAGADGILTYFAAEVAEWLATTPGP